MRAIEPPVPEEDPEAEEELPARKEVSFSLPRTSFVDHESSEDEPEPPQMSNSFFDNIDNGESLFSNSLGGFLSAGEPTVTGSKIRRADKSDRSIGSSIRGSMRSRAESVGATTIGGVSRTDTDRADVSSRSLANSTGDSILPDSTANSTVHSTANSTVQSTASAASAADSTSASASNHDVSAGAERSFSSVNYFTRNRDKNRELHEQDQDEQDEDDDDDDDDDDDEDNNDDRSKASEAGASASSRNTSRDLSRDDERDVSRESRASSRGESSRGDISSAADSSVADSVADSAESSVHDPPTKRQKTERTYRSKYLRDKVAAQEAQARSTSASASSQAAELTPTPVDPSSMTMSDTSLPRIIEAAKREQEKKRRAREDGTVLETAADSRPVIPEAAVAPEDMQMEDTSLPRIIEAAKREQELKRRARESDKRERDRTREKELRRKERAEREEKRLAKERVEKDARDGAVLEKIEQDMKAQRRADKGKEKEKDHDLELKIPSLNPKRGLSNTSGRMHPSLSDLEDSEIELSPISEVDPYESGSRDSQTFYSAKNTSQKTASATSTLPKAQSPIKSALKPSSSSGASANHSILPPFESGSPVKSKKRTFSSSNSEYTGFGDPQEPSGTRDPRTINEWRSLDYLITSSLQKEIWDHRFKLKTFKVPGNIRQCFPVMPIGRLKRMLLSIVYCRQKRAIAVPRKRTDSGVLKRMLDGIKSVWDGANE